jgi:hypothetical protein
LSVITPCETYIEDEDCSKLEELISELLVDTSFDDDDLAISGDDSTFSIDEENVSIAELDETSAKELEGFSSLQPQNKIPISRQKNTLRITSPTLTKNI